MNVPSEQRLIRCKWSCERCGWKASWNGTGLWLDGEHVVCAECILENKPIPEFMGHRDWRYELIPDYWVKRLYFRSRLYERDGGICGICGKPVDYADMDVDHIRPKSWGGPDHWDNLQVSHSSCNRRKGARMFQPIRQRRNGVAA